MLFAKIDFSVKVLCMLSFVFNNEVVSLCDSMNIALQGSLSMEFMPGKDTGVGCHFLLQGIFLTQRSNPHLLHWQADSLPLSHQEAQNLYVYTYRYVYVIYIYICMCVHTYTIYNEDIQT